MVKSTSLLAVALPFLRLFWKFFGKFLESFGIQVSMNSCFCTVGFLANKGIETSFFALFQGMFFLKVLEIFKETSTSK